jgi:peptide/nickel transport system substrate-binding protein
MYPYDPDRARGLLDAAGVRPGPDGIRFSIDLVFDSSRQEYGPLSVALQKFWGAIGVKVNLRGSERAVVLKQVYGDYDFGATIQNYGTSGDPALGIARLYVTDSIQQGATFNNVSRYSNPEVDRLFEEGQNSTAQEQRAVYYHQVQAILARDLPTLNINQMGEYDAATRHLHNLFLSQDEPFWDEVWIEH